MTVAVFIKAALSEVKLQATKKEILALFTFKLFSQDGMELGGMMTLDDCGLNNLVESFIFIIGQETVIVRPEKETEEELTAKLTAPRQMKTDSESVHQSYTKAGYLTKRKTSKRFDRPKKRYIFEIKQKFSWVVIKDRTMIYFASPSV